ncbi:GmrSD restriction endonuclease domain-containing protein [Streptomyces sp. NPDC002073]
MIKNSIRRGLLAAAMSLAALAPAATPAHADQTTLLAGIAALPTAPEDRTGYNRDKLYPHWKDLDRNGCSARADVLIAEAIEDPIVEPGCKLVGGLWHSYYDDIDVRGSGAGLMDVDHMIPLAEVHDSGGGAWSQERRTRYANDIDVDTTLVGVSARSNRAKADRDPAEWMPIPAARCQYLGEWVSTKLRWSLSADEAERKALLQYAAECPDAKLTYEPAQ